MAHCAHFCYNLPYVRAFTLPERTWLALEPTPSSQGRPAHLLILLVASLGLVLLMRGSMATARSTFQTPLDTPTPLPTATEAAPVATDTPAPPPTDTPTPPPTDEGPDLPTPSATLPSPTETPVAPPTSQASPLIEVTPATATPVPPTATPVTQPGPTTAVPTTGPVSTPSPQPAGPQLQEPETLIAPETAPAGLTPTELAVLIDSLIVAGGYVWLCCGVVLVLFIPAALLWLNRRGKRRARGL